MILQYLYAFLICGLFSLLAQIILDNSKLTVGHITSIFVVIGVFLEFIGIYEFIREIASMGASMPISSFGSIIMSSIKKSIDEIGILGIFKGVFNSCGALLSFSIFIAFISTIFFKPKS